MPTDPTPSILIELGEDRYVEPVGRRGFPDLRRWARPLRFAVPVAAVVLLASASVPAAAAPLPPVAHLSVDAGDRVAVVGSQAIVVGRRRGRAEISAYGLPGGRAWTAPLAVDDPDLAVHKIGDVVVVDAHISETSGFRSEAFSARTGARLWESREEVSSYGPGDALLLDALTANGGTVLRQVDVRTGAARWTLPVGPGCSTRLVSDPDHGMPEGLVELCFNPSISGTLSLFEPTLRVVDMASGTTRASRQLDLAYDPSVLHSDGGLPQPQIGIVGGFIVITHINIPFPMADEFAITDLAPVWSAQAIVDMDALQPCGDQACLTTVDGVRPIDPVTGVVRPGPLPFSGGVADTPAFRLAEVGVDQSAAIPHTVDGLTVAVPVPAPGRVWLVRQQSTPGGDGLDRSFIELLDGVGGGSCLQLGAYLTCATSSSQLTFWRLPS